MQLIEHAIDICALSTFAADGMKTVEFRLLELLCAHEQQTVRLNSQESLQLYAASSASNTIRAARNYLQAMLLHTEDPARAGLPQFDMAQAVLCAGAELLTK